MKFIELPEDVQKQAALTLSKEIEGIVAWDDKERTEKAKSIAISVRESFKELCADS